MKVFTLLFSLYILVLVAIPCIDKPLAGVMQKIEIPQSTHGNHDEGADHCSPFCTCACCATFVIQLDHGIPFNSFSYLLTQFLEYSSTFVTHHLASIWQPPKIS